MSLGLRSLCNSGRTYLKIRLKNFANVITMLSFCRFDSSIRGRNLAKNHFRKHSINTIQIPYLNLRIKCTNSNIISYSNINQPKMLMLTKRPFSVAQFSANRKVEPFNAQRKRRKHNIVMDIQVVFIFFVNVYFQMGNIVFRFTCKN